MDAYILSFTYKLYEAMIEHNQENEVRAALSTCIIELLHEHP